MEYFALPLDQKGTRRWLIYYTNDQDGFATDKDGKILIFASPDAAEVHAKKKKWKLKTGQEAFDLDFVQTWAERADRANLDCPALYRAWNLLGDVANSLGQGPSFPGYSDEGMRIHEELFWGCNLPGMAPADHPYIARLSEDQGHFLSDVFQCGLELLQTNSKQV